MRARLQGSGRWAPGWETAGMSARCLSSASCGCVPGSRRSECAGQGAHREVGSEGFEANRRAVADEGEPVGQIQVMPSLHYGGEGSTWGAWAQQGVCGRHGGKAARVTPGGLARSRSTGSGTRAYKPSGEVAGDAVREIGVAHGTREPGKSKSPGIVPARGGEMATQTAPSRGKGSARTSRSSASSAQATVWAARRAARGGAPRAQWRRARPRCGPDGRWLRPAVPDGRPWGEASAEGPRRRSRGAGAQRMATSARKPAN
jgi:hypothetical protein